LLGAVGTTKAMALVPGDEGRDTGELFDVMMLNVDRLCVGLDERRCPAGG